MRAERDHCTAALAFHVWLQLMSFNGQSMGFAGEQWHMEAARPHCGLWHVQLAGCSRDSMQQSDGSCRLTICSRTGAPASRQRCCFGQQASLSPLAMSEHPAADPELGKIVPTGMQELFGTVLRSILRSNLRRSTLYVACWHAKAVCYAPALHLFLAPPCWTSTLAVSCKLTEARSRLNLGLAHPGQHLAQLCKLCISEPGFAPVAQLVKPCSSRQRSFTEQLRTQAHLACLHREASVIAAQLDAVSAAPHCKLVDRKQAQPLICRAPELRPGLHGDRQPPPASSLPGQLHRACSHLQER